MSIGTWFDSGGVKSEGNGSSGQCSPACCSQLVHLALFCNQEEPRRQQSTDRLTKATVEDGLKNLR